MAPFGGRRRQLTIGAAIVIPIAIAVGSLIPRDSANEIERVEVVERFRSSTLPIADADRPIGTSPGHTIDLDTDRSATNDTSVAQPGSIVASAGTVPPAASSPATDRIPALVEPGVYVYRTTGFEHIDVLSGHTHEYPAETTITVVRDACGVLLRWDALEERREEWRLCSSREGVVLQTEGLQYHEFFDQETPEVQLCDVPVAVVPAGEDPAGGFEPVAQACTLAGKPWLPVWEVLDATTRDVSGVQVDVRHVRMTIDDNDDHFEHYVADWMLAPNGLPVELTVRKQSKSPSVVGDVVYDEQISLELVSVEPLR